MRSNRPTGETRSAECAFCGSPTTERRFQSGTKDQYQQWWTHDAHEAPCGAPCIGGGVEARSGNRMATFDHAHRVVRCGSQGCEGGKRCST